MRPLQPRVPWRWAAVVLGRLATAVVVGLATTTVGAQDAAGTGPGARYARGHARAVLTEFMTLLRIPSVAADTAGLRRAADSLVVMLGRRGVRARLLTGGGSPPVVLGELASPGATRTVVMYAHYDGQPVNPSEWASPPFDPVIRKGPAVADTVTASAPELESPDPGWRVYARSASDDKGAIMGMLAALDALRADGRTPDVNLKFFFEGGEEAGSPGMKALLTTYRSLLDGDVWLFCDGPEHQSGRPQLIFGVRGQTSVEVTVYGPSRPLHDGHYGNWAPNPASELATLLAGLRDPNGHIRIRGFYDDVRRPTRPELEAIRVLPSADSSLRRELGLAETEAGDAPLAARIMEPALNIRGIQVGSVGKAATNAIQSTARASIDFRLVPAETPDAIRTRTEAFLSARGYTVVHDEPTLDFRATHARVVKLEWSSDGYAATRSALDSPFARAVYRIMQGTLGTPVYRVPTLGGSLPTSVFTDVLHRPVLIVPIANYDNNQHAANENIRIGHLWNGIALFAALFEHLGSELGKGSLGSHD